MQVYFGIAVLSEISKGSVTHHCLPSKLIEVISARVGRDGMFWRGTTRHSSIVWLVEKLLLAHWERYKSNDCTALHNT